MKTQYNFKIEDTLKQELEAIQQQDNINNKEEFLQALLNSHKHYKASQIDTEIDLSKYETVSKQTKTILYDAFKHILATIESNNTNTKQQALQLEKENLSIVEERKEFKEQAEQLKADYNQKFLNAEQQHKEELQHKDEEIEKLKKDIRDIQDSKDILSTQLSAIKQELVQVQTIAEQVQSITSANKELREELKTTKVATREELLVKDKELQKQAQEIKELQQQKFKDEVSSQNQDKEIKKLEEQLKAFKELERQNIVLSTKLEILEKER